MLSTFPTCFFIVEFDVHDTSSVFWCCCFAMMHFQQIDIFLGGVARILHLMDLSGAVVLDLIGAFLGCFSSFLVRSMST